MGSSRLIFRGGRIEVNDALIGHSGYVGSTLLRQRNFGAQYRASTIHEISGRSFGTVVCAGAPAQKWIANREPEADQQGIERLIAHLESLRCNRLILISTVDVFRDPNGVDEGSVVDETGLHPYGLNRRRLEQYVEARFAEHLIVRLPGLVGPGLRKNVIFDFLNENRLDAIDSRSSFQFYPMVNLWYDIQIALEAGLNLIHLTALPISVAEVALLGFGRPFTQHLPGIPAVYDLRTRHATLFGTDCKSAYQVGRREVLQAIRAYAQSEPRAQPVAG